ncbi:hypothetical protein SKB0092_17420 [Roseomonas mucosa]
MAPGTAASGAAAPVRCAHAVAPGVKEASTAPMSPPASAVAIVRRMPRPDDPIAGYLCRPPFRSLAPLPPRGAVPRLCFRTGARSLNHG